MLLLSLSAISPALHAWLHDGDVDHTKPTCAHTHAADPDHDSDSEHRAGHACAVTLFAQGVVHQATVALTSPCEGILRGGDWPACERLALAPPRYLHLPPHAPPAV